MKCIIGSLLFLAGIANVVIVRYDIHIGIGIWCGLTVSYVKFARNLHWGGRYCLLPGEGSGKVNVKV